ncbi:hypothetical protein ACFLVG_00845 [Chloroflexota bacterium]
MDKLEFSVQEGKRQKSPVPAIDAGGTKIITAPVYDIGEMIIKHSCLVLANGELEAVTNRIFSAASDCQQEVLD